MSKKLPLTKNEKNLLRRYFLWCYKTTKEELDKVDRYFTQLKVDDFLLKHLKKTKEYKVSPGTEIYKGLVDRFEAYMKKKEDNVLKKKFKDSKHKALNPDYQYLHNRFVALEKAVRCFLGIKELEKIRLLYEQEMSGRILQAREH